MALAVTCDSPPTAVIGSPYSHFFPVTGETGTVVWSISVGTLPAGLAINSATGEVSGTPTGPAGASTFTVHVADDAPSTANVECSIEIAATLDITCDSPPDGEVGVAYSHFFPATGGVPPYTFSLFGAGVLPGGLTLDPATGEVSGIPTTPGVFPFTVQVDDSYAGGAAPDSDLVECSITIAAALGIACDNPPEGTVGTPYSHFFPATGGVEPYTFSISAGALPDGLSIDPVTGEASGTPTIAGTFTFTVQVEDALGATAEVECSIDIALLGPVVQCNNPPPGKVNLPYTHDLFAFGGVPPYTFAITAGALPPGLSLGALSGTISGTPTTPGIYVFTVQITDADDVTDTVECSIIIKTCLVSTL